MAGPLDASLAKVDTWTDLSGFGALRQAAQSNGGKDALPAVARQFEAIFTQMMLKSMRDASFGDGLGDSEAGDTWRDLYDQQLAVTLSSHGKGLGIADMLVRQLGGHAAGAAGGQGAAAGQGADATAGGRPAGDGHSRIGSIDDATRAAGRAIMKWLPENAQEFVRELAPHAMEAARKLGLSLRSVLAQAALETQWGRRMPHHADGSNSFNLFGIKADESWNGARVSVPTLEYEDGVAVRRQAQFRAYASPADAFDDYARLIGSSPRYARARGRGDDVAGFARALSDGGYATDPEYAAKVAAIADSEPMRQALEALKKSPGQPNP
jgi:flagellar protein FlgJ